MKTAPQTATTTNLPHLRRKPAAKPSPPPRAAAAALAISAAILGACSSDPPVLMIDVITGQETDAFTKDPSVTRVDITAVSSDGEVSLKASAAPGGSFDFGEVPDDLLFQFEVTGVDATGATVVRGRSLSGILLSAVSGDAVPVFAQRLRAWARPPGGLPAGHVGGPAVSLAERYVVSMGGSSATGADGAAVDVKLTEFYDLFAYGGAAGPVLPRLPKSSVARTEVMLLIDDAGATWVDFSSGFYFEEALPEGLASFADVAGGKTIDAPDGRSFVIGATKTGAQPTKSVLVVNTDGSLDALELLSPRAGAAAAWLESVGLVVAGGNATDPGVEVLAPGATAFASRPFPPDGTEGAGAVVADPERLALVGGVLEGAPAQARTLDLRCSSACAPILLPAASIPIALASTTAYALGSGEVIAIGDEVSGDALTRTFLVTLNEPSAIELPLREPRKGASTVPAPNGTLALLGGVHPDGTPALSVETLFP
jgi:hypothetical protein